MAVLYSEIERWRIDRFVLYMYGCWIFSDREMESWSVLSISIWLLDTQWQRDGVLIVFFLYIYIYIYMADGYPVI